jgi:hypothetical protein
MQYRPSAAELLADIAALLDDEVIDAVDGPLQHRVRVAANLAHILARELSLASANAERERATIGVLLDLDDDDPTPLSERRARLAEVLRAGPLPGHHDAEVWSALVQITRDDLAISKPGHDRWTGDR